MKDTEEPDEGLKLQAWAERLDVGAGTGRDRQLFENMPSGRLLNWLRRATRMPRSSRRSPRSWRKHNGGPQFGILLLDLDADMVKLQATFDSLVGGHCKAFKMVVFTTGDLPATTTCATPCISSKSRTTNYVERINQIVAQSTADWLLLAEAGDQFTASGLLRASLELMGAEGVACGGDG